MKSKKRPQIIWNSILAIFVLTTFFLGNIYQKELDETNIKMFNEKNIQGRISYLGIKNHGNGFKVVNDDNFYVFYPVSTYNKDRKMGVVLNFRKDAKVGDSISKPPFSDTLYLFKEDSVGVYKYFYPNWIKNR